MGNHGTSYTKTSTWSECICCFDMMIRGLCCQKQVSQVGISNYIPQFTVGCSFLSLPEIPASGNKVLICVLRYTENSPVSKVHGANMGPAWVLPSPGGPHVGPMNFAIWVHSGNTSSKQLHGKELRYTLARPKYIPNYQPWPATDMCIS